MKSYTNIEQSKKLVGILSPESADMFYDGIRNIDTNKYYIPHDSHPKVGKGYEGECPTNCVGTLFLPCWSLAALLEQFEDTAGLAKDYGLWFCYDNRKSYCTKHYDNPIDACVETIIKLNEQKLL